MSPVMSEKSLLSTKDIDPRDRLIFALDVSNVADAKVLVEMLGDSVQFYKLGLQLFMAGGYFELLEWLRAKNKHVFVDLKFFDVPRTVECAVEQLKDWDAQFATVHGNENILEAAVKHKKDVKILAVTVLTSLDDNDLRDLGFECSAEKLVLSRARRALKVGCDGVISSGLEVPKLREEFESNFLIVVPGIRPVKNVDDQKRTVSIEEAFLKGADYVVIGRPIRDADDPKTVAEGFQKTIASLFA